MSAFGAKQLKLAGSWLSGAAKLAGYSRVADTLDVALLSIDVAEDLRPGQDDAVKQALRRVRMDVEAGTKAKLAAEFGTDWERRVDLSATIEALPLVLECYALDVDAIVAANLEPERIAERTADAADAAHEELFCKDTLGDRMLRRVVEEAYAAALSNKDFALRLLLRGQREVLDRQDRHNEKLAWIEEASERRHRELLEVFAREKGVDPKVLAPLFDHLGQSGLTLDEMRRGADEAIQALLSRAHQKVKPSNDGADIDATIGAARTMLGNLDTAGARSILTEKIAEEETARRQRLVPILEEQAAIERLSYDYEAAKSTLRQLLALNPERISNWIELGDLFLMTAALDQAVSAFRYSLAIAERLAKDDPGNAGWQRDLLLSHVKVGEVRQTQGDLAAALTSHQASLAIAERLAKADPNNAVWQREIGLFRCATPLHNGGMKYGYARVSTDGQSVDAQVRQLTKAGCKKVFREVASGAKTDRVQLRRLLGQLEAGDVLTVTRLDRLARSTRDLLNTLATIAAKEAGFRSLGDTWADTPTSHGRLMLTVLGGLAEFERDLIRVRTGEGRERAKARGVKMGRKPKLTPHQKQEILRRKENGEALREIARSYNVHNSTISRLAS